MSLPRSRAGTNSDINGQMEYSAPIAMPIIRRLQQLKGSELVPPFEPLDNNDLLALSSGNLALQKSFVQTISQTLHEIHSFMKNGHDKGRRILSKQTKDVMMFASRHS
ncbi:hypothetical protein RLEG12_07515 (plasmid) [Rhizobium leguminosarum bv. trifolii CB782]|nr:hypothetical protein RLEG12_07515 [Rhizobium leguminosarum bv. trifolii CB782]